MSMTTGLGASSCFFFCFLSSPAFASSFLAASFLGASAWSSSGGAKGKRASFFSDRAKISVGLTMKGSGWRGPQGDRTELRRSRSDRKYSHAPSGLHAALQLSKRSLVTAVVVRSSGLWRKICPNPLAAGAV